MQKTVPFQGVSHEVVVASTGLILKFPPVGNAEPPPLEGTTPQPLDLALKRELPTFPVVVFSSRSFSGRGFILFHVVHDLSAVSLHVPLLVDFKVKDGVALDNCVSF